ncbi:hypothetical protein BD289DRAFT_171267 [Coniella lustricola]|uniref:Secreted protein n=1 Tax=Coniella lustricola TaxID=2025994 RepID=A0A2T3ADZ8_9PEZI|nr:hypothetical protein BD289DRAFT_171267 [Coniella lustricola]
MIPCTASWWLCLLSCLQQARSCFYSLVILSTIPNFAVYHTEPWSRGVRIPGLDSRHSGFSCCPSLLTTTRFSNSLGLPFSSANMSLNGNTDSWSVHSYRDVMDPPES